MVVARLAIRGIAMSAPILCECGHPIELHQDDSWGCFAMVQTKRGKPDECSCKATAEQVMLKTIDALRAQLMDVHDALHAECNGDADLPAEVHSLRAENERLREAQRWIPTSDAMPDAGTPFLARCEVFSRGEYVVGVAALVADSDGTLFYADCESDTEFGWNVTDGVFTHWKPIDPLPTEGSERADS
jgi:hypothetical protein